MENIYISGFADEISSALAEQLTTMKELNLEYLSLRSVDGKNIGDFTVEEFEKDVLPRLSEVRVSSLGTPLGKVFINDEEGYEKQTKMLYELCKIANLVNCKYLRMFSFYIPKGEDAYQYADEVMHKLSKWIEICKEYGVVLLHENEKDIYGDTVARCKNLMEKISCDNFKAIFDFANFVQVKEDTMQAYNELQPYIEYIHIKDACYGDNQNVVCGTGDGKIPEILKKAMSEDGYTGFLTMEPHLVIFDALQSLELEDASEIIKTDRQMSGAEAYATQLNALKVILETI